MAEGVSVEPTGQLIVFTIKTGVYNLYIYTLMYIFIYTKPTKYGFKIRWKIKKCSVPHSNQPD